MTVRVDLNADLGEGFGIWQLGDDAAMLGIVTSANLACGFHAGDPAGLRTVCRQAAAAGVRIGAQVGYRDLAGFGRRFIDVAAADLIADVIYQVGALQALARSVGTAVGYVKPHGALYNTIVTDTDQAAAVAEAVHTVDADLPVVGLAGSAFFAEALADRAYRDDATLVPRSQAGALLHDPGEIADRVLRMVTDGTVTSTDGSLIAVRAESVCVHGDSPGAVQIAQMVRDRLVRRGIRLEAFC